ncbi:MAG: cell wall-binding repeat-containing protein, partial [Erysipelotrichaceae bacterium]|nr:cell wall-binding repeat-containing protein [Erysipelotrichaceae bacterium]
AAKGHDWSEPEYKWSADNTEVTATRVCKNDKEHVETETVKTTAKVTKEATCEEKGETTYTAEFKNEAFKKQEKVVSDIEATGHKWNEPEWKWNQDDNGVVTAVATFVCANDPKHVVEEKAEVTSTVTGNTITHEAVVKGPDGKEYMAIVKTLRGDVVRIFGNDRYETGLKAAEFLADIQGVEKFDNVVLTTGQNFPDALSGAYLARTLNAPILLIKEEAKDKVQKYIKEHLNEGGEILVLGGENAVKEEWLGDLGKQFKVSRVRGDTRYLTNIDILNKVDYKGGDILVCTGKDYADSLSGSAVDMPILLVNDALTKEQTEYLSKIEGIKFHIVGGTSAVSAAVEKELAKYGEVVERFAGETRYETSTLLAEAFFEDAMQAVLAYGVNFPDGLCGGVIAAKMGAPLIVTISGDRRSYAADYCGERSISSGAVLGGSGLIDDVSVRKIFMMNDKDEIVIYERE